MTPLTKSDLIYFAKQLPKVEPFNHEDMVIRNYERSKWEGVLEYEQVIRSIASSEAPRDTIYTKVAHYTRKVIGTLRWAYNRLKQYYKNTDRIVLHVAILFAMALLIFFTINSR